MEKKDPITNENIKRKFKSQFELVNYSIKLAEQMIHTGRAPNIKADSLNPAVIIIEEIEEGKDKLEDVLPVSNEIIVESQEVEKVVPQEKAPEKRRARRIFA